jgi:SAM-dependent methyltransferase
MSNLYSDLSEIYEGMYQTFINYEDELEFYSKILSDHHCRNIVELGCGTGSLASLFSKHQFNYTGIDLSEDMLQIARRKNPGISFIQADMRDFKLTQQTQAVIIAGRSISYLITNQDVQNALSKINQALHEGGIICFDCIDALRFIPKINKDEKIIHRAVFQQRQFQRDSYWKISGAQSWTFDWQSIYFEERDGSLTEIGKDHSTIRAFTRDEMTLFLTLCGFEVLTIIDRPSYAFETLAFVAKKVRAVKGW